MLALLLLNKRGEEAVNNDALIKLLMQPNEQQSLSALEQALIYYCLVVLHLFGG